MTNTNQTTAAADRNFSHRTRNNVAAIQGLASAIATHAYRIELVAKNGGRDCESKLQALLADLMMDTRALESAVVDEEQ